MESRINNLKYVLVPGKVASGQPDSEFIALHNAIYAFRNQFWVQVFYEVTGDRRKLTGDEFMRQDVVGALVHENEVIGMQTYTFFDLRSQAAREHSFMTRYFDDTFLATLTMQNISSVMSIENFSIHPDWRSSKVGLSLGRVILSLGLKIAESSHAEASIAAARSDVAASSMALETGAERRSNGIMVLGCPTDLVVWMPQSVRALSHPGESRLVHRLWAQKTDYYHINEPMPLRDIA